MNANKETFVARMGEQEWTFEVSPNGSGGATSEGYVVRHGAGTIVLAETAGGQAAEAASSSLEAGAETRHVTWTSLSGGRVLVRIDGRPVVLHVSKDEDAFLLEGASHRLRIPVTDEIRARSERSRAALQAENRGPKKVLAPMPGTVVQVLVKEGQDVEEGQALFIIEAMKMQNEVGSPMAGRVRDLRAAAGKAVEARQPLLEVVPTE